MSSYRWTNPYASAPELALRGNLHTHTDRSDGQRPVQEVIDDYAAHDYDFLVITDHDRYLDLGTVDSRGMLLIPGTEVSLGGGHILQVGSNEQVPPDRDRQGVLDAVAGTGAFAVLCHPRWQSDYRHISQETLEQLSGYDHLEVYNAGCRPSPGSPDATSNWDMLLSKGRRVWGHAVDDTHSERHVARGWDMVYAREPSVEAILEAYTNGAFYFSTGVTILSIAVHGDTVRVDTENADVIEVVSQDGYVVAEEEGKTLTFSPTPRTQQYCRMACYGRGLKMAWTQPFFLVPAG